MVASDQTVIDLEPELLSFNVRRNRYRVEEILDPDFREIGASGRWWTRAEIISALADEHADEGVAIEATQMVGTIVVPGLVLLTYVSCWQRRRARRTSLWRRSGASWRLPDHQGTRLPDS